MRQQLNVSVRRKPKNWSFGLFVAACLWIIGEALWSLGTNLWYLGAVSLVSFVVDTACTGSSSREGVYIDNSL